MLKAARRLARCERGSVAPTVALSLVGLIAAGGLAVDYAQLANLDTELQNAADQAALAAATQLDQQSGAIERATAAAQALVANDTRFANDGDEDGQAVTIASVTFYDDVADAEANTNGFTETASFASAKFVRVTVNTRRARYAMTPIVGMFQSGTMGAAAVAGLGSAICKTPPVMICNPDEPKSNTDADFNFDANAYAGRGLRLVAVGNGTTNWAPGNFGYLNVGSSTSNPNLELRQALGWTAPPGECSSVSGVQTRTGAGTTVTQALNTRFDIYEKEVPGSGGGAGTPASCPPGGSCPPSINTVKDVVLRANVSGGGKCGFKNGEWELPTNWYRPSSTADLTIAQMPAAMGHPRDKCHAVSMTGTCAMGRIGDGAWDRNAYFYVNYGWTSAQWPIFVATGDEPISTSTPTRYQVYRWEIANRGDTIGGRVILGSRQLSPGATNTQVDRDQPICSQQQTPSHGSGLEPGGLIVDRRRISAAVLNCEAQGVSGGGNTVYPVLKWIDLFLVEPSLNRPLPGGGPGGPGGGATAQRTDPNDVYVEILGETSSGQYGGTAGQVVRRDKPYLVK